MSWMTGAMVAASLLFVSAKDDPTDLEKLGGTWKVVQMVEGGKELPKDKISTLRLIIKENKLLLRDGRDILEKGSFELDPKANPKEWTTTSENEESKPIKCIYKIGPRQVVLCIGEPGGDRPKEFASREKSGIILIVLERFEPNEEKPRN